MSSLHSLLLNVTKTVDASVKRLSERTCNYNSCGLLTVKYSCTHVLLSILSVCLCSLYLNKKWANQLET